MRLLFLIPVFITKVVLSQEKEQDSTLIGFFESELVVMDSCSHHKLYDAICPWMETPYKYAGSTKNGTDCSGFAKSIYKEVYQMELLGGSRHIFKGCVPIEKEYLDEGDLVFFKINGKTISHVGIYLNSNKFVHASTKAGVIISDLNEPYYSKRFFSGGRIGFTALE